MSAFLGECTTQYMLGQYPPGWSLAVVGARVSGTCCGPEVREDNNERGGNWLGGGSGPELVITSVTGPASVLPEGPFQALVTVCNEGSQAVSGTTEVEVCNQGTVPSTSEVAVVFSTDDTFTRDDVVAGSDVYFDLEPGQCVTVSVPGVAYPGPGNYQLGAIVDSGMNQPEFSKTNNTGSGGGVDIL